MPSQEQPVKGTLDIFVVLRNNLEYERELLCDELVIGHGIDHHDYARLLLDFARVPQRLLLPRLPVGYLPLGRRTTVKARIHHLLEENMEHRMGKLSARWAIVLGTGLLTLLLGLASYRLLAQEPEKPAPPGEKKQEDSSKPSPRKKPKRGSLRYGGKNFDQWRVELETELKSEIRVDGMTALAAFGANGYGTEATQTILELIKGYNRQTNDTRDQAVVIAAFAAIEKIGESAVPTLWEGVQSDNGRVRCFAIECLARDKPNPQPHIAKLLKAARDEDYTVRREALGLLARVVDKPKSYVPVLRECLKDKIADIRARALGVLKVMHPEAAEIMPALKNALKDVWIQDAAIEMAESYGVKAKPVVPELLALLDYPTAQLNRPNPPFAEQYIRVLDALAAIGPEAKEALPKLRKLRNDPVAKIGIGYKGGYVDIGERIRKAIKKIEGE